MTQYVINIGAIPNDGTGDPLRTAFNETNLNFNQVFAAGPVLSNIRIANNTILTTTTNGNLILAPNGIGRIQANATIVPSVANVRDLGSATQRWNTVYTQYLDVSANLNIAGNIVYNGDLTVDGNLTVQGNIIQVGNIVTETLTIQLANAASTANAANGSGITVGANDNIATLLFSNVANAWTTNIGISSIGNITAPYFVGNGSLLTGLAATYGNSNVVTLLAGFGSNTVSTTGNISGGYLFGNGSQLTGLAATYGNANVVAYGESGWAGNIVPNGNAVYSLGNATNQWNDLYVSNATIFMNNVPISLSAGNVLTVGGNAVLQNDSNTSISTTGNITAGNISITGGSLTWSNASIVQTSASDVSITGDGQVTVRSLGGTYQWTFDSNGNLTAPANVSATGNVTGAYIKGNGSELTSLPAPVVTQDITSNGAMSIMTYDGNIKYVNYATVEPSSGNIAGGNITTTGLVSATGNVTGNYFIGNGSQLTGISSGIQSSIANGTSNVNIATANGNATITANAASTWTFGTDSTLTLPAGSSRITSYGQITIETDNNASGMYLNADGVNLLYANANVTLRANSIGTNKDWNFGNTGVLTLPNSGVINTTGNSVDIGSDDAISLEANAAVNIYTDTNGTAYQWTFGTDGNLTLPAGGIVYETNIPDGGLSGSAIALKPTGGTNADQQLLIYPTVNDANHLHLTTGNLYNTELFLGDDNLYVKLANTGNVVVNSNDDTGNTAQWTFGANGNLTLPGNIIAINYANGNRVTGGVTFNGEAVIGTGTSNTQSGLYLAPDPVSLTNDLYLRVRGNIIDEPTHIHFDTGNNQYYNQYIGDDNKYILLANTGNVVVNTNDNAGNSAQWIFNNFGTLTLPGGSRIRPLGANLDIIAGTGSYVNLTTSDESSSVGVDNGGGYIVTAGGTWDFGTTGNLTAPGNISAVGNVTAGNISAGSGTITGGNVNGANFNGNVAFGTGTVGGSGNITGGNLITTGSGGDITMSGGNITGAGNISATGNITGNYFIGNGSQLTGITASVPNQTILPTIQTITVSDTSGVGNAGGGGSAFANVTVANTIPVTEYGVIITDGTSSQKYATGALGNIPGTVKLNFTTGLNNTPFTVFAYVTSNAGTYYSDSATGTSGICLLAGTQIALSDGTRKAIEHITYTDKLLSWDFDRGCYAETTAMWIKRGETGSQYNLLTFSDGTTLRTFDQHRIFNKQAGAFTYPMTDATPVGTVTVNEHGQEITLTNKQVIVDTIEYYNVITDHHMNLFSDTVLTSCRFNNIYPITDMKFVKDGRTLRTRAEFENIPDRFFYGLRLAEQTTDIETVEWYVNRLLSTEVSTESELTV